MNFLPGWMPAAAKADASKTLRTSALIATNGTSFSFTGVTMGSPFLVIAVAVYTSSATPATVSALTANGVGGTFVVGASRADTVESSRSEIWIVPNPGASGTVVITTTTTAETVGITVWSVNDLDSGTATDSVALSGPGGQTTTAVDILPGGVCFATTVADIGATPAYAWTGLTEDFDSLMEAGGSIGWSTASIASAAGLTAPTITATPTPAASGRITMAVAAFR